MDKFEYRIRAEEINALIEKKQFIEAVKIADTIDWSRVKSVMMLCKISELYKYARRFEDAKEILLLAYDRQPGGRKIVYSLCELSIKLEETVQAVEYYKEFVQVAPTDTRRFILQYRLYEAQDVSLEERIAVLEEYKKRDYREKWAYELAYLYHRIGLATRCVEECDELILWFGEGKYVTMAMELKMLHVPLSASQQEKYDRRFMKDEPEEAKQEEENTSLPIEIKAVDVTKARTTEIIPEEVRETLEADTIEVPNVNESLSQEQAVMQQEEVANVPDADEAAQPVSEEEIPLSIPEPDLDIQVKTVDVGEYNTINLQQELAQNISRLFAEEDMEAADATMALPIETIIDTANNNEKVINSITDDVIKDALLAPLLQDTGEMKPITEEDLLASMEQERREKEEAERLEAERLEAERLEAERLEAERQEAERQEAERLEAERQEAERLEAERQEAERLEAERQEAERLEAERQEAERLEAERLEAERLEAERLEAERLEAERLEAERQEAERLEAERLEAERLEAERLEAERLEAERLEAERLEAERLEAERLEAERLEAERLEAERLEAERLEAERQEAERLAAQQAAVPVTAGAIMAAEIAHAVTTGNTSSLNIGQLRADGGLLPNAASSQSGEEMVDEQITGQLSLLDIMNDWEETKKANEEKRIAQMREKVMKQTGPMFSNFDEIARASVATDLDLINPAVDVFKQQESVDQTTQETQDVSQTSVSDETANEIGNTIEHTGDNTGENIHENSVSGFEGTTGGDFTEESPRKVLNTEEINGIEEKLLEALAKTEEKEEPIPTFVPDIDFDELKEEIKAEEEKTAPDRMIIAEEAVTPGADLLSAIVASSEAKSEPLPVAGEPQLAEEPQPMAGEPQPMAEEPQPMAEEPQPMAEEQPEFQEPMVSKEEQMQSQEVTVEEMQPQPEESQAEQVSEITAVSAEEPQPATPAAFSEVKSEIQPPVSEVSAQALQPEESSPTAIEEQTTYVQHAIPQPSEEPRLLTKEEKENFGVIAPTKELQEKVTGALDLLTLYPGVGNAIVVGENGTGRDKIAKNLVKHLHRTNPAFSGAVAKISGKLLATKDIGATLESLENGALIIEEAGELEMDILGAILYQLEKAPLKGILVVLEDRKEEIKRLAATYPQLDQIFNAKIEIEVLDNDGLVEFAKEYAKSQEYAIDEMAVLAVYTRISDMQTNEHAVTVAEVKAMVNDAIDKASKKSVKRFMDVIIGKRFDEDDMIILREKDFSIE